MTTWSKDELRKIAEADGLHISPFREDKVTYGTPTWIWPDDLRDIDSAVSKVTVQGARYPEHLERMTGR